MGKTTKFFKALLGFKTSDAAAPPPSRSDPNKQPKRRWSFGKSHRDRHLRNASNSFDGGKFVAARETPHPNQRPADVGGDGNDDTSQRAIAVAAATAAVAEAAVAAAHAAAEVVRLTSRTATGPATVYGREEWAAVKIQSHFRAYLARRALKALKGLVKLQALVRGHILRKQTADMMRRLQALIRAQARARAGRAQISDSSQPAFKGSSHFHHYGPATPEKFEHVSRAKSVKHEQPSPLKRNGSKSFVRDRGSSGIIQERPFLDGPMEDEKSDKILEIDTGKPHTTPRRRNLFQPDQTSHSNSYSYSQSLTNSRGSTIQQTGPSPTQSCEVNSLAGPLRCYMHDDMDEEVTFCTAESSPQFLSASSKGNSSMRSGPFTPAKSDSSRSCLSGYSDHPNYMAYTESSRAKVRSLSAPRQRPQFEVANATKRYSIYGYGSGMQRYSTLRDSFASKAYPGSGRLDRLGMPVGPAGELSSSFYLNRY